MKKAVLFLILGIVSINILNAQEWKWQNPIPQGNTLKCIKFVNDSVGYAVGINSILKTTNGGVSWSIKSINLKYDFNSLFFLNADTGYVVGENGIILYTTDGCTNWTDYSPNSTLSLRSVFFTDANTGYVVGHDNNNNGVILKTSNGGRAWTVQNSLNTNYLYSVYFTSTNIGYIVGYNVNNSAIILKTTNGGSNWVIQSTIPNCRLFSISFPDTLTAYAVGDTTILKTVNGGTNWITQNTGGVAGLVSVSFKSIDTGYAVGNLGKALKTTNGGLSWNPLFSGTTIDIYSVFCINANTIYTVSRLGSISKSTNGGISWMNQSTGNTNYLTSVHFTDLNTGYAVGNSGTILKTTNGGLNWSSQISGTLNNLNSICFINSNIAYIVGSGGVILKSTNAGMNWTLLNSGVSSVYNLYSVYFIDTNTGYAVGDGGTMVKTIDGGINWTQLNIGTSLPINSVCFVNSNKGFAIGQSYYSGLLFKTTDGGITWTYLYLGNNIYLNSICFADSITGYAVGNRVIYKTTDGGITWYTQTSNNNLTSVFFINNNIGFTVGDGFVNKTINGGLTWFSGFTGTNNYLTSVFYTDTNIGYVVGENGTILKTDNYPLPGIAGIITGDTIVCQNENNVYYSVPFIPNASQYIWTLPSGSIGISTTNSIAVNYTSLANSGNISVKGLNSNGIGTQSSISVTIQPIPTSVGFISGNSLVCRGQNSVSYSVPVIDSTISYVWSLPNGAIGSSNTNIIDVNFTSLANSGTITVRGQNTCSTGDSSIMVVTVNSLPANADTISGINNLCISHNTVVNYLVPSIVNANSYIWTLPDHTIQTTSNNNINVTFDSVSFSGYLKVKGANYCGIGNENVKYINVAPMPQSPTIIGMPTPQPYTTELYSVSQQLGKTYNWTVTNGNILTGTGTNYITVQWGNTGSGDIYVSIADNNNTNCTSSANLNVNIGNVGIENFNSDNFSIYPNPTSSTLTIETNSNTKQNLEIVNLLGQSMYTYNIYSKTSVDVSTFPKGIYLIKLNTDKGIVVKKFVKE